MTFDERLNRRYFELGASFVAVGAGVTEFSAALRALAQRYRPLEGTSDNQSS